MTTSINRQSGKETLDAMGRHIEEMKPSEKKLVLQMQYHQLLGEIERAHLTYEQQLVESRARLIAAETTSESWLQKNWRPMLMLLCIFIVLNNYILVPYFHLPLALLDERIWNLIEIGVTGYMAGRSLEKISERLGPVLVKKSGGNVRYS